MKKILTCVGTRPNFIKIVKFKKLFESIGYEYKLLHTGQHFDEKMSAVFFHQLKLDEPDYYLGINASSNNQSVGKIIIETEKVLNEYQPDLLIVPGDVNSTFACAFAAASLHVPIAHIESGLRSFDMSMPEERNRILTDAISSLLFVTEKDGVTNLENAGIDSNKIKLVGNTIIDTLMLMLPLIDADKTVESLKLNEGYCLVTMHRPINVDVQANLSIVVDTLLEISKIRQVVFPIHPRTLGKMKEFDLIDKIKESNILLIEPQGYIEFLNLIKSASCIISDSGGVQIESSFLNVPCFTIRDRTELKITLEEGTNILLPLNKEVILSHIKSISRFDLKSKSKLWDGKASERIVEEISLFLNAN